MKKINRLVWALISLCFVCSCTDDVEKYDNWPTWETRTVISVAGKEMTKTYYNSFTGTVVNLAHGQEVDLTGFEKLKYALQSQYWEVTSDRKAKFKGDSGEYDLIYDGINKLLYVENANLAYPDALYVIGAYLGHSGATGVISTNWSIDAPDNAQSCCRVSDNVFKISLFLGADFGFKFFKHRGWGSHPEIEIWASDVTLNEPALVQAAASNDFIAGPLFQPGVYDLTIDLANKTLSMEAQNSSGEEDVFSVNGTQMTPSGAYMHARVELENNREVSFSNFGGISDMVQPDFFEIISDVEGKAKFLGVTGIYDVYYDVNNMLVYIESPDMNLEHGQALWACGSGFGHSKATRATGPAWQLTEPVGSYQCAKVGEGVYETTLYLEEAFDIKFFGARDWGTGYGTDILDPLPIDIFAKGYAGYNGTCGHFTGDLIPGTDFKPGVYTIRVDVNHKILYAVGKLPVGEQKAVDYKVNGKSMTDLSYNEYGYKAVELSLAQGQEITFENFQCVDYMIQPEYFEKQKNGTYKFRAVSGTYRILYQSDIESILVERMSTDGLWITGQYFGHPKFDGTIVGDPENSLYITSAWGWENPKQYLCCAEITQGVYETSIFFHSSWIQFTLYGDKGWSNVIKSSEVTITGTSSFGRSYTWDHPNEQNFGATVGGIGSQYGIYRLKIDTNQTPVTVDATLIEGFGHHQ